MAESSMEITRPVQKGDLPLAPPRCTRGGAGHSWPASRTEQVGDLFHGTSKHDISADFAVSTCPYCGARRINLPNMPDGKAAFLGYLPAAPAASG